MATCHGEKMVVSSNILNDTLGYFFYFIIIFFGIYLYMVKIVDHPINNGETLGCHGIYMIYLY